MVDETIQDLANEIASQTGGDAEEIEATIEYLEAIKREEEEKPPKPPAKPVPTLSGTKAKKPVKPKPQGYRDISAGNYPIQNHGGVSASIDPKLLAMQPPPDYLDTLPTVRGRIRQEDLGVIIEQLKGMAGVKNVDVKTQPDGTAELQVVAEAPQPVADMITSLIPATPAEEVEILTVKGRGFGPLTNVVHDEVMFDFKGFPKPPKKVYDAHSVTDALVKKRKLAWEVYQALGEQKLVGPWVAHERNEEGATPSLVRYHINDNQAAFVGPLGVCFCGEVMDDYEDSLGGKTTFETLEDAMAWVDAKLELAGFLPV